MSPALKSLPGDTAECERMENETDGWKGMTESTEWIHRGRCMTVSMEMTPGSQPSLMQALFMQMNRKDTLKFCHWSLSVCLSKTISSSIFMLYSKLIKCSVINEGLYGLNTFKTESPLNLQKKSHNYSFRIFTFLHNFRVYIEFWKSEAY